MSVASPFIHRPVGTALLTASVALAGIVSFRLLPVSPLPQAFDRIARWLAKRRGTEPTEQLSLPEMT